MKPVVFFLLAALPVLGNIGERRAIRETLTRDPASARGYLSHESSDIRRYAAFVWFNHRQAAAYPELLKLLNDPDDNVRIFAVRALMKFPQSPETQRALKSIAANDPSPEIRALAARPGSHRYREQRLLREDPSWDYDVAVVHTIELKNAKWRMIADPVDDGEGKGYADAVFQDDHWLDAPFGDFRTGRLAQYHGTVWYRAKFPAPAKMDSNSVELRFPQLHGSASLWLNGVFVGETNPDRKNPAAAFNISAEMKWNAENFLVLRLYSTEKPGGIMEPPVIEVLK